MRKTLLYSFLITFLAVSGALNAQTASITVNASNSINIVTGSSAGYHASEHIYLESEIGAGNFLTAGTAINQVAFKLYNVGTNTTVNNFKIYLMNVPAGTTTFTTGAYSTAGYTEVYNGSFTVSATGWVIFNLTTPFVRTAGSNLQVMTTREDNIVHTNFSWDASVGNTTSSALNTSRRYNGAAALAGQTMTASTFRAAIQIKHAVNNDPAVTQVYTLGKIPKTQSHVVKAYVFNNGLDALTNVPVTLDVTGANTYSNTQNIASLAVGTGTTVTFPAFTEANTGTNTIAVSVPADGDNTNNSKSTSQLVAITQIGYPDGSPATTSIGYNTGAGLLVTKHNVNVATTITAVRASINIGAVGNQVYGVVLDAAGAILAQSPNYTVVAGDANNYVSFPMAIPPTIPANTDFYIGLGQVANAVTGYFPLNTQTEDPGRTGAYYGAAAAGGATTEYTTLGRFMIEASFNSSLPVSLTTFVGEKDGSFNKLSWTTETEINNRGFEIQRSADGKNFSRIGFFNTKAEHGNSTSTLNYVYNDERPLSGMNYYRLLQIDNDGKSTYSNIVSIKGEKAFGISAAYPNPVRQDLNVIVTSALAEKATVTISDATGKIVKQINTGLVSGDNNLSINVSSLASGVYYLRVVNGQSEFKITSFIKN